MLLLLLSFLCISTALASPLLGEEQCAKGSAVWCQNVKTASLCGAVKHCQQTVWNKPTVKSMPCDLCKEVITVVGNLIKDNATEVELQGYLDKACGLIPDQSLASQCKEEIDQYLPVILDLIKGELENPEVVCSALGLCKSLQQDLAQQEIQTNKITEADLSELISPFIANVPLLRFPQDKPQTQEPKPKPESNGDVCQDCVQFVTDVQIAVKSNSSFVKNMIDQIEKQCDLLGPGMSDMCKNYISQYAPQVIQMLVDMDQKSEDLCNQGGFCQSQQSVPLVSLIPAKILQEAKVIQAVELKPAEKNLLREKAPPMCELCELVIKEIDSLLLNNRTEENVIQAVEKVCSILPSTISKQCKDFVEQYGPAIVELLIQEVSPQVVCTTLGLCSGKSQLSVEKIDPARLKDGEFCEVCKTLVRYLDGILEDNATQAEIEAALEKVCNFLPDSMKGQCNQIIAEYGPVLLQLLVQMIDPDFVCTKLNLCAAKLEILGMNKCSWGPSYWCSSMETASKCNAVEHCKHHVWN